MKAGNQICTQLTMKLFTKNVPIHFYHTSGKVQVQGSPMIQGMSSVVWLVEYLIKPLAAAHIESNEDVNTEILPGMQEETGSKCLAAKGSGTLVS
jgi:hypothetical protein